MKPRSAKAKGTKFERWLAGELSGVCHVARRQPGSGIYADFPHDLHIEVGGNRYIGEAKHWRNGWRTGDNAMGGADFLFIKADRATPRVYMTMERFLDLCRLANEGAKARVEAMPLAPGAKP